MLLGRGTKKRLVPKWSIKSGTHVKPTFSGAMKSYQCIGAKQPAVKFHSNVTLVCVFKVQFVSEIFWSFWSMVTSVKPLCNVYKQLRLKSSVLWPFQFFHPT